MGIPRPCELRAPAVVAATTLAVRAACCCASWSTSGRRCRGYRLRDDDRLTSSLERFWVGCHHFIMSVATIGLVLGLIIALAQVAIGLAGYRQTSRARDTAGSRPPAPSRPSSPRDTAGSRPPAPSRRSSPVEPPPTPSHVVTGVESVAARRQRLAILYGVPVLLLIGNATVIAIGIAHRGVRFTSNGLGFNAHYADAFSVMFVANIFVGIGCLYLWWEGFPFRTFRFGSAVSLLCLLSASAMLYHWTH